MTTTKKPLFVKDLTIQYHTRDGIVKALDHVSFSLVPGKNLGIAGESGSGKTSLAHSLLGLIQKPHKVSGDIHYDGVNFQALSDKEKRRFRWQKVAMVFQNATEVLNPLMKVGKQISEPLRHASSSEPLSEKELDQEAERLLELAGLDPVWAQAYPHQLSGGMQQKALLAMALSCNPDYLILDEPTSSLDSISRKNYIETLQELQQTMGFSMIVISHDLSVLQALTEKMMVLYGGHIAERGNTGELIEAPAHPYTRGLINSAVELFPYKDLWGIPGEADSAGDYPGCSFYARCTQSQESCSSNRPGLVRINQDREVACHRGGNVTLLDAQNLSKTYQIKNKKVQAVNDVDLQIFHGETLALIGCSGSGKSTIAKMITGFIAPDQGQITFEGQDLNSQRFSSRENGIQLVLQDPFASLSHRLKVQEAICEPLAINRICHGNEALTRVRQVLQLVQLPSDDSFLNRYISELSGGQRQRVAIARALIMKPKLLIADEITSMLDVSTQANIMRLLKGLQNKHGFAMIYITHDLQLARKAAERMIVLHHGVIVEQGSATKVTEESCHSCVQELIQAGLGHG